MKKSLCLVFLSSVSFLALAFMGHAEPGDVLSKLHLSPKAEWQNSPTTQQLIIRVGPFSLPANVHHSHMQNLFLQVPFDAWFLSYQPSIVDGTKSVVPKELVHHVDFFSIAREDFLCRDGYEHFFSIGQEMQYWPPLRGVGYRVTKGRRIMIRPMLKNPTGTPYHNVFIEVQINYQRVSESPRLKNIYPAWFHIGQCVTTSYDLKPGRNVNSSQVTVAFPGRLLGVGGHMHTYGTSLMLENESRHEEIVAIIARKDSSGSFQSMPIISLLPSSRGYRLNRNDRIKLTAVYENPTGKVLRNKAMGIMVGYFLPDDDVLFVEQTEKN